MTANFWQTWKEFEIRHGNEDTIREMLRIKRSVQATYNTQVNFMSSQMLKATTSSTGTGERTYTNSLASVKKLRASEILRQWIMLRNFFFIVFSVRSSSRTDGNRWHEDVGAEGSAACCRSWAGQTQAKRKNSLYQVCLWFIFSFYSFLYKN